MFQTRPENLILVERIADALAQCSIGSMVTWADLDDAVGTPVRARPDLLCRARRKVETETGTRFENVHGRGIKRLSAADVAALGGVARRRMGRIARTTTARLTGLKYNDLTREQQAAIDRERSVLGAISLVASAPTAKLVEKMPGTGPVLPVTLFRQLAKEA